MDSNQRPSTHSSEEPARVGQISPSPNPPSGKGLGKIGWLGLGGIAIAALLAMGILPRLNRHAELQAAVKAKEIIPTVNVFTVRRESANTDLVLPGTVVSQNQTTIYSRTTGYLSKWLVDIGDRVQKGQLLAQIESPEIDRQVSQARAELAQAQANLVQTRANLAKAQSDLKLAQANLKLSLQTVQRWQALVQQGAVTQQAADEKQASYQANLASIQSAQNTINSQKANVYSAEANVNSSQANLQRYIVLQSFEQVKAPFSGVITARNVNEGALITAGSSNNNNNTSLYTLVAYDTLQVNVNVPQSLVRSIQTGQTAQIQVRELPQRVFKGKVIRTTNALDPSSRTLLTQMAVQNQDQALRPGMYATVKFSVNQTNPPLMLPDSALVINSGGTQVATVTKQTVHYQPVQLGRDYGTQVEVTSGLSGNETLISNPTVDLVEGTRVKTVATKQS